MRGLCSLCIRIVLLITVGFAAEPTRAQDGFPPSQQTDLGIAISYSLLNQRLTLHEPVIVAFAITNRTAQTIKLDLGQDRKAGFAFTVVDPSGSRVSLPPLIREGIARVGTISVQPGSTYSQKLLLNEWYSFSELGTYEFAGHLTEPIVIDGAGQESDRGFRMVIEIGPRDEVALTKACDALASRVESSSYQGAADAALALSRVNDPIAVSYLSRILFAQKLVEPTAIEGLERIANRSAVETLGDATKSKQSDTAILARAALQHIRQQTNDSQIREEVDRILAER